MLKCFIRVDPDPYEDLASVELTRKILFDRVSAVVLVLTASSYEEKAHIY